MAQYSDKARLRDDCVASETGDGLASCWRGCVGLGARGARLGGGGSSANQRAASEAFALPVLTLALFLSHNGCSIAVSR